MGDLTVTVSGNGGGTGNIGSGPYGGAITVNGASTTLSDFSTNWTETLGSGTDSVPRRTMRVANRGHSAVISR